MELATIAHNGWELDDGELRHLEHPDTFEIPPSEERRSLRPGAIVKLIFRITMEEEDGSLSEVVERMWVKLKARKDNYYQGVLDNDAQFGEYLVAGTEVVFEPRHVIQIWREAS